MIGRKGRIRGRLCLAAGTACLLALLGAQSAAARAVTLSKPHDYAYFVEVESNPGGRYVATWDRDGYGPVSVFAGSTSSALKRGAVRRFGGPDSFEPMPAVGGDGTAGVLWSDGTYGKGLTIQVALKDPGADWLVQEVAPKSKDRDEESTDIAIGPQGQALAVWTEYSDDYQHDRLMGSWRPPGGSFGAPYTIYTASDYGGPYEPSVKFDGAGKPTAVWNRSAYDCCAAAGAAAGENESIDQAVQYAEGDATGAFGPTHTIGEGCDTEDFDEVASGAAVISLTCNTRHGGYRIRLSQRLPGGSFSDPRAPTGERRSDFWPSVALSEGGEVLATWLHRISFNPNGGAERVSAQLTRGPIGEPLPSAQPIPPVAHYDPGRTPVFSPDGKAYVAVPSDWGYKIGVVRGRRVIKRKRLTPRHLLVDDPPSIVIDAAGRATAFWGAFEGGGKIQAIRFHLPG